MRYTKGQALVKWGLLLLRRPLLMLKKQASDTSLEPFKQFYQR